METRTIYVGNIPAWATPDSIQAFFSSTGVVTRVALVGDNNRESRFAFVEFLTEHDAQRALSLDQYPFGNSSLRIQLSKNPILSKDSAVTYFHQPEAEVRSVYRSAIASPSIYSLPPAAPTSNLNVSPPQSHPLENLNPYGVYSAPYTPSLHSNSLNSGSNIHGISDYSLHATPASNISMYGTAPYGYGYPSFPSDSPSLSPSPSLSSSSSSTMYGNIFASNSGNPYTPPAYGYHSSIPLGQPIGYGSYGTISSDPFGLGSRRYMGYESGERRRERGRENDIYHGHPRGEGANLRFDIERELLDRTVYISKLDAHISEDAIRQFFSVCGSVTETRLCGEGDRGSRFGFVEFSNPNEAHRALSLNRTKIGEYEVIVSMSRKPIFDSVRRELLNRQQDRIGEERKDSVRRTVYVGNIPCTVSHDEFKSFFGKECGPVERSVVTDDRVKPSIRFGFLEFSSEEFAHKALSFDDSLIWGIPLKVKMAKAPILAPSETEPVKDLQAQAQAALAAVSDSLSGTGKRERDDREQEEDDLIECADSLVHGLNVNESVSTSMNILPVHLNPTEEPPLKRQASTVNDNNDTGTSSSLSNYPDQFAPEDVKVE